MRGTSRLATLLTLPLLVVPLAAIAQSDLEINAAIEFNFSTPGARSLAMGGAFIGLADDATAAFTNPAGLTILSRPEVSAEYRHQKTTLTFTHRGHGYGPASGMGLDIDEGVVSETSSASTDSLSFLAAVIPRDRWSIAFYRHQLANHLGSITTQGAFYDRDDFNFSRLFPVIAEIDLDIATYGVSAAFDIIPSLSVGAGVSVATLRLDSIVQRFDTIDFFDAPLFSPSDLPLRYSPASMISFQTQIGSDEEIAFNLGVLWRAHERVSVGAAYRYGPRFDIEIANHAGLTGFEPGGLVLEAVDGTFDVPDVIAAGVAVRVTDNFSVAFDYDRVTYSDLTERMVTVFGNQTEENLAKLQASDADELHLGAEYVFPELRYPIALRGGVWYDPAHAITHQLGDLETDPASRGDALIFRERDDVVHWAAGIGFVLGSDFQLDAAVDLSKRTDVFSLSGVYRF